MIIIQKRKFRVKSYPTQWTALRLRGGGSSRRIFLITVIFNESNYMPGKHELFCNFRPPRETEVRVVRTYEVCVW